jgi:hypothetical protein
MFLGMNPVGLAIIGFIILILIAAIIMMVKIRKTYKTLEMDANEPIHRKNKVFENPINRAIAEQFIEANNRRIDEINTIAIIDKNAHLFLHKTLLAERFVSKASGLMIVLGLVGTFFGLTLSIVELVDLLSTTNASLIGDTTMITGGLLNSINGMSVAFVTSLFGITASIIINVLTIIMGVSESRERYFAVMEEYLDNVLGARNTDMTYVDEEGKTPLEIAFVALGDRLAESIHSITEAMSYRMTVASNSMKDTAEVVDKSLGQFNASIETFASNTRDFGEFNHDLRTNIQRMSVAFEDFTEQLKLSRRD